MLVLLAMPPILSGTYAGIEARRPGRPRRGQGHGHARAQVLRQVELPCALPLLLSGVRSATLQVIATATIAASIGLGGLGRYLIDGSPSATTPQMAGGAVLVAVLALVLDGVLALVQRRAVSPGLVREACQWRRKDSRTVEVDADHGRRRRH